LGSGWRPRQDRGRRARAGPGRSADSQPGITGRQAFRPAAFRRPAGSPHA
jgi:hypothetical protein